TGPLMTGSSPIDNATDAGIGSDLIVTFNEAVKAGTGYIYISYSANGTYARVIDVNETSQISFSGNQLIIDPTSDLTEGVGYNVSWNASAVTDLAGNAFGGGYPSSFHFVTADPTPPQLVSTLPVDDATGVYVDTNLRLGFNEVVKAGSGTIEIRYASDGSIAKSIPITDTRQVTFDGYQIIINPNTNLQQATSYYVTLASGVVLDLAGNPFGGVSSPNVFNFSTPINVLLGTLN